jgi:transmembrane 9 superfamily member 3
MYEDRGEMVSTTIVCYALSSAAAGYVSGSYYRQFFPTTRAEATSQWQKVMIFTIALFPGVVGVINIALNWISFYYSSLSAIPFSVAVKMIAIWGFVALPLAVVGTIMGRHLSSKYEPPCRVNSIPRPIPSVSWYCQPSMIIPVAGILPFGSIFIEMYFMFTSFWSYKFYYVYGFMLLVFVILSLVTVSTTIVAIYVTLNVENYNWQWISFASASSSSIYVFLYSIFYFFYKTQMTGFLQIAYYFGYM